MATMDAERLILDPGGAGQVIHLAHANGFPPATCSPLAATLTERHRVIALPSRALWPRSRPESAPTWRTMADDLVRGLDELRLKGIVGVGHSLGGVLTLWAAIKRPSLFRAVVLIDPVILPPRWLWMVRLLGALGQQERLSLVQGAQRRRRRWASRQVCFEHLRSKALFANWSDIALKAYVDSGTRQRHDGQVTLIYPPEWEAHIFASVPTDIWRDVPHQPVPSLVIRGEYSTTFLASAQARMARQLPHAHFLAIPDAGHLVPLERPVETGRTVLAFLEALYERNQFD